MVTARAATRHHTRQAAVGIFVSLLVLLGAASSAHATEVPTSAGGVVAAASASVKPSSAVTAIPPLSLPTGRYDEHDEGLQQSQLPLFRWLNATNGFHSRLDTSLFNPQAIIDTARRDGVTSSLMLAGNANWGITTWMVSAATQFDMVDSAAGGVVDAAAGELGERIVDNPAIFVSLLIVAGVALLWKLSHARMSGASAAGEIVKHLSVIGVMVVMIGGAMNTTYDEDADTVDYGTFSPGWVVHSVNTAISSVAGTVTTGIASSADMPDGERGRTDAYSCFQYVEALESAYEASASTKPEASTVLALNGMWKLTGLEAWISGQFSSAEDGRAVYCRLLEQRSNVTPAQQLRIINAACLATHGPTTGYNCTAETSNINHSLALAATAATDGSTEATDISIVGWAVCKDTSGAWGDGQWASRWDGFNPPQASKVPGDCDLWWNASSDNVHWWTSTSSLNIGPNPQDVSKAVPGTTAAAADQRQFLWSLHGNAAAGANGTMAPMVYVGSSLINLIAFGLASILILVAKVMSVVFMLVMFVVLLATLVPGTDGRVLAKFTRQFLGMTFIAFGYSILLSLILLVCSVVVKMAVATYGAGTIPTMLMSGVAPLLAWMAVAWVFKSIFHAPNPLSLRGGLAYAGAAGAVGGTVASMVNRATRQAGDAAVSRISKGGGLTSRPKGGKAGGAPSGSMRDALPANSEGASTSEVKAARNHASKKAALESSSAQAAAVQAGADVVAARTAGRAGKKGVPLLSKQADRLAAFAARQRALHNSGQALQGNAMVRAMSKTSIRISDTMAKPRAHASSVVAAAARGDWDAMRTAAGAAAYSAGQSAKDAAVRASRATAKGAQFAAQHPIKTAGRVAVAGAIAGVAMVPGGLPVAAAGAAVAAGVHHRSKVNAAEVPPTQDVIDEQVRQYRDDQAAATKAPKVPETSPTSVNLDGALQGTGKGRKTPPPPSPQRN